jgi:hypothetical protein
MNWIEIDRILYRIIARHTNQEDMFAEAEKQFRWNRSQSEAAIKPLLKRNNFQQVVAEKPKKASRQLTKRK